MLEVRIENGRKYLYKSSPSHVRVSVALRPVISDVTRHMTVTANMCADQRGTKKTSDDDDDDDRFDDLVESQRNLDGKEINMINEKSKVIALMNLAPHPPTQKKEIIMRANNGFCF